MSEHFKKSKNKSKQPGGRMAPGARPVDESTRIDIAAIMSQFQASDEQGAWGVFDGLDQEPRVLCFGS
jgi:hypothetical protein